jgi:hypothetical protein
MIPTQQSHTLPSRTCRHTSQNLAKSVPAHALQKSKSIPSKNFKNATHSRPKNSWTETAKTDTDKGLTMTVDRRPACNSGFAKKRVQWLIEHSTSHQLLWYVDSLVLRNPLLRIAANRYKQP